MTTTMQDDQQRAIDAQATAGLPYARTRKEVKAEAQRFADETGLRWREKQVTVSTWMGGVGDSYCLHLDSQMDGDRVVVHTWHSTGETTVRRIFGSFWRPKRGREGFLIAEATPIQRGPNSDAAILAAIAEVAKAARL